MSYLNKYLIDGEDVLYTTRLHWVVFGWQIFFMLLCVAAGLFVILGGYDKQQQLHFTSLQISLTGLALIVLGAIIFFSGWVKRNATVMNITNMRILVKLGIATRRTWEMPFSKIESVSVEEPMLGRLLGYGNVVIRGVGGTPESFHDISHPLEFRRRLQQQIERPVSPAAATEK